MSISGQLGSLDATRVENTFNRLVPELSQCLARGSSRVEFLGGHVKFFVRIGLDGAARWAYLSQSTLGDRDTERCMLGAVKGAHFPEPIDGEGQAEKSFDFDPSPDVREPVAWDSGHAQKALSGAQGKLAHCTRSIRGKFKVTAYVGTDGTVLSAGATPPDERGEGAVDCVVEAVKELKFASPGSWPAKVSFEID